MLAAWAKLGVVRIARGVEETGRWDLLLVGRGSLRRLVGWHLGVVAAATVSVGAAVAAALVAAGADLDGSALYGAALALVGVGGAAWGAVAGQLVGDRRRAATLGAAGIGAALLARMVADGVEPLTWLHWLTPFGLLGQSEPFARNRWGPLAGLAAAAVVSWTAAVLVRRRRDLHAGVIPARAGYPPHPFLLRSLPRFALRRAAGPFLAGAPGPGCTSG